MAATLNLYPVPGSNGTTGKSDRSGILSNVNFDKSMLGSDI